MKERVEKALEYAKEKHEGQTRKFSKLKYISHPMEVMSIISTMTKDEDVLIAGLLHDTIEDSDGNEEEIKELFGERVVKLVLSETENQYPNMPRSESWILRKRETIEKLENADDIGIKMLWIGDKLSNLRSFKKAFDEEGVGFIQKLNNKDINMHKWYYGSICNATKELKDNKAWKEMNELYKYIFERN